MLKNTRINLGVIRIIATALSELNERVVYVGGAVVSLYINDPAAEDVRPTKDIDISLKIASIGELEEIRESLTVKGFKQSPSDDVICRFRYEDIKVDVMSTKAVGWAPANPWFEPGFKHLEKINIEDKSINILQLSYFLATKFSAFKDRGGNDARLSHDFEDITYILDNRIDLVEEIQKSPKEVKEYLKDEFKKILANQNMKEALLANLYFETQEERYNMIIDKLNKIVEEI
jgi:predicted nucleotidyltransferase